MIFVSQSTFCKSRRCIDCMSLLGINGIFSQLTATTFVNDKRQIFHDNFHFLRKDLSLRIIVDIKEE